MRRITLGAVVAAAMTCAAGAALAGEVDSSNPLSGDKEAIEAGKTKFRANCAYCHGMKADGRGRGLPNSADLTKFKRGYSKFVLTVKEGGKTMPPWGGMGELTDEQINQVGAYLETLAGRQANWLDPEDDDTSSNEAGEGLLILAAAEAQAAEPMEYQVHLGHLLDSWQDTPGQVGLVAILEQETDIASEHAGYAVNDLEDFDNIKLHTAHVRQAVSGEGGGPGKGYGIIKAVDGVIAHMELARDAADASDSVKLHAEHVIVSAGNIRFWAGKVLDKAAQILGGASPVSSAFFAEENVEQLGWIRNGRDADGDGSITWQEGEGGLAQIKEHLAYIE